MKNFWIQRKIPQEMEQRLEAVGAQDLAGRLHGAIPAISLNSQTTLLTALLNDVDPALIFAQQVYGYGKEGDALLAFSTAFLPYLFLMPNMACWSFFSFSSFLVSVKKST